ncbi:MAG: hypothetical protein GY757_43220 [bacterium]|nr:hypothetical protein [bacterium]
MKIVASHGLCQFDTSSKTRPNGRQIRIPLSFSFQNLLHNNYYRWIESIQLPAAFQDPQKQNPV